ncbi:hypothetical protein KO561_03315 [Radiobacillus kanasensis]|uniref:CBO0543 family protein n=1 Tax=Radiobacillus kanasensis TaxID=2844358 RepID=UPI001E5A9EC0|nr:CBO0543 family protein [Radiobacillus kanasensis]UFU00007.1 hypothetical protein KO561_03315 [Radiobacillus kanasensis]
MTGTAIILSLLAYFIPKQLTRSEMYTTSLFAVVLNLVTDIFLDLKWNLYGYFDKGVDWENLIAILGIYPAVNIIFLNFFPVAKSLTKKTCYIFGWSIFGVVYEWIALQTEFFYHNNWSLLYSAVIYPILYLFLYFNWKIVREFFT